MARTGVTHGSTSFAHNSELSVIVNPSGSDLRTEASQNPGQLMQHNAYNNALSIVAQSPSFDYLSPQTSNSNGDLQTLAGQISSQTQKYATQISQQYGYNSGTPGTNSGDNLQTLASQNPGQLIQQNVYYQPSTVVAQSPSSSSFYYFSPQTSNSKGNLQTLAGQISSQFNPIRGIEHRAQISNQRSHGGTYSQSPNHSHNFSSRFGQ